MSSVASTTKKDQSEMGNDDEAYLSEQTAFLGHNLHDNPPHHGALTHGMRCYWSSLNSKVLSVSSIFIITVSGDVHI